MFDERVFEILAREDRPRQSFGWIVGYIVLLIIRVKYFKSILVFDLVNRVAHAYPRRDATFRFSPISLLNKKEDARLDLNGPV